MAHRIFLSTYVVIIIIIIKGRRLPRHPMCVLVVGVVRPHPVPVIIVVSDVAVLPPLVGPVRLHRVQPYPQALLIFLILDQSRYEIYNKLTVMYLILLKILINS
jgi:hypothetical protein